jgi:hypothetical protein
MDIPDRNCTHGDRQVAHLDLKWGVQKRLEFLEFQLFWNGRFNRADLADAFGISSQQATVDIAHYQRVAPSNLTYDHVLKAYLRSETFAPLFIRGSSDRFLLQLVAIQSGWMTKEETWFDELPLVEVVKLGRRPTNHRHLLAILDAMREHHELSIDYQSMTGTPESWRAIAPHAMAYSAGRWYVRAWSREHNDFRDYNLNRILDVRDPRQCTIDKGLDYEWAQKIDLILVPNSKLSPERQIAVASEYDMVDGRLTVPVRLSLSFYLMSEYNLDVPAGKLQPEKQQLVLINREDVEQARRLARQMAKQALGRAQRQ